MGKITINIHETQDNGGYRYEIFGSIEGRNKSFVRSGKADANNLATTITDDLTHLQIPTNQRLAITLNSQTNLQTEHDSNPMHQAAKIIRSRFEATPIA